jgi:hypothetical protein
MKKLTSIGASLMLAFSALAAGVVGVNPPQSGVLNFDGATTLVQTKTFAYPFQTTPLVTINGLLTNNSPFTVSAVTTTGFTLTVTTLATTNASVAWQAFVGGTRLQSGILANTSASSTAGWTNTFSYPYAAIPSVVVSGSALAGATNNGVTVSSVSTTGFSVATGNTNQTVYWQSVGTVYNPASENVGQNPVSNKIVY